MRDFAEFRVARIWHEAAVARTCGSASICLIAGRATRYTGRFEHLDPVAGRFGGQHRAQHGLQRITVLRASLVGRKTRVSAPFGDAPAPLRNLT